MKILNNTLEQKNTTGQTRWQLWNESFALCFHGVYIYILLYFFFQNIYFSTERERRRRRQVFSLPTTTPDNKTVSRWVGEAVEGKGEEKWANASSQNQSTVFFFLLDAAFTGILQRIAFRNIYLRKLDCRKKKKNLVSKVQSKTRLHNNIQIDRAGGHRARP
jgi:hypothetical protein